MIKIGDRVVFPDTERSAELRRDNPKIFPPVGTKGTVFSACTDSIRVMWDGPEMYINASIAYDDIKKIDDRPVGQIIKDSGDRTKFSTGAERDYHPEEKGRMDLLPWNAIGDVSVHCARGAAKYSEHNVDLGIPAHSLVDSGLRHIRKFICGETDEDHLVAAVWNFMWLLEMRSTHPELMDIPWRANEQEKG